VLSYRLAVLAVLLLFRGLRDFGSTQILKPTHREHYSPIRWLLGLLVVPVAWWRSSQSPRWLLVSVWAYYLTIVPGAYLHFWEDFGSSFRALMRLEYSESP